MKVLLVDDHPLILSALQAVIQGLGDHVSVVGAGSAGAARQAFHDHADLDLVLLDLSLGDADGFDVLAEFRAAYPTVPVVVVSASERASDVIRSIDLGAMGFIPKRTSNQALVEALRMVVNGGLYIPPTMLGLDLNQLAASENKATVDAWHGGAAQAAAHQQVGALEKVGLTPRQTEVMGLLLKGLPNKLIARELNLSVETVKDHVAAVLRALGVNTRTQAVLAVSQMTQGRSGVVPTSTRASP
jgi:DNA-binding NarL/FixJ family response regulator